MSSQSSQKSLMNRESGIMKLSGKKKSNLAVAVSLIVAVHVTVFGALLIQGCKQEPRTDEKKSAEAVTNAPAPVTMPAGIGVDPNFPGEVVTTVAENPYPSAQTNLSAPGQLPPPAITGVAENPMGSTGMPVPSVVTPEPATGTSTVTTAPTTVFGGSTATASTNTVREHKVVSGENFSVLAKRYGVTVKAIREANPDVDPSRLQIGTVLTIPESKVQTVSKVGSTGAATPAAKAGDSYVDTSSGQTVYVVSAGDNLTRIAKRHKVSVADLKAENRLASDRIVVGQKLRIPGSGTATAATAPAPTSTVSGQAAPAAPVMVPPPPPTVRNTNATRTAL